jgi:hypothetical protein
MLSGTSTKITAPVLAVVKFAGTLKRKWLKLRVVATLGALLLQRA